MTTRSAVTAVALLLSTACAAHEGRGEGPQPVGDPKPAHAVTVSIASVQMIQDCPDPPEPTPAQPPAAIQQERAASVDEIAPGAAAKRMPGDGGSFHQPCTQSTVQIKLDNDGADAETIAIRSVRLLAPGSMREIGTLAARKPSLWDQNGTYRPWDQKIAGHAEVVASYRLSMPDWAEVEREIGGSSMGRMFVLEVEVEIDGEVKTVRSPEFPRDEPHVIVT